MSLAKPNGQCDCRNGLTIQPLSVAYSKLFQSLLLTLHVLSTAQSQGKFETQTSFPSTVYGYGFQRSAAAQPCTITGLF